MLAPPNKAIRTHRVPQAPTLGAAALGELARRHHVSWPVLHLLAISQCGVVPRWPDGQVPDDPAVRPPERFEFGGVNLEIWPHDAPERRFFKSLFVPAQGAEAGSPYVFCERRSTLFFVDAATGEEHDTGLRARRKVFLRHASPHFYFYQVSPRVQVSAQPVTAACPEGCRFCPVTYWKGSISARYNPIEGLVPSSALTPPEQLVAELLDDAHLHRLGGLCAVEQIALATTRFGKKPTLEQGMYEDYAIRLGRSAHAQGFRGRMFLLSDRIRSAGQMANVRRRLVDHGVPAYFVYTLEMADDARRREIMPGDKGALNTQEILAILARAKLYFAEVGAFYIVGIDDVATSLAVLRELAALQVKPGFNALNPLTAGIHALFHDQPIVERLDGLLQVQAALVALAVRRGAALGEVIAENNNSLVPKGSRLDADGRLVL